MQVHPQASIPWTVHGSEKPTVIAKHQSLIRDLFSDFDVNADRLGEHFEKADFRTSPLRDSDSLGLIGEQGFWFRWFRCMNTYVKQCADNFSKIRACALILHQ